MSSGAKRAKKANSTARKNEAPLLIKSYTTEDEEFLRKYRIKP